MKLLQELIQLNEAAQPMTTYKVPVPASYSRVYSTWLEEMIDAWKAETKIVAVETVEYRGKVFKITCSATTVEKLQADIEDSFGEFAADKIKFFSEKAAELFQSKTGSRVSAKVMWQIMLGKELSASGIKALETLNSNFAYDESVGTYKANATTWRALGIDESDFTLIEVFAD